MKFKNHTFHWQAERDGIKYSGNIEASTQALASQKLWTEGFRKIAIKKNPSTNLFKKKIDFKSLTLFFKELSVLFDAGIPIIACFDIILSGLSDSALHNFVSGVKLELLNGSSLSTAFAKQGHCIDELTYKLIVCGEYSGTLSNTLQHIAASREKQSLFISKIKNILFYPTMLFVVSIIILLFMLLYVIPKFGALLMGMGAHLPYCTRLLLTISTIIKNHGFFIFFTFIIFSVFFYYQKKFFFKTFKKLFFIKKIIHHSVLVQLLNTLHTCLKAGITLDKALKLTPRFSDSTINQDINTLADTICKGHPLSHAMEKCPLFPSKVIQLTRIAEQSGKLESTLLFMANDYQQQLEDSLSLLSRLLEPVMISILGIVIGGMVIALYLPIFKLGESI